ncbi:ABC-type transport system periplasmic substrate-binding protein (probable substrate copper) [Natronomonas moolapensis 8.8.11]|uniref:ABC-type transport system periplasmic substrate-binding protein (Probable substrate copper) n=1 Tax=Natronomonas moolapensis (strain DSM 18674 / CECT 7526 / JCM 14361 / 8.8.11) TaxID=268739 RepID=M1XKA6_NATM8|nr:NosD domain-containing protein [Natronomonas moolapensis]CCQ35549.1 ABC-type transport system periplasmic substrate-binding protein (probable substrate copper) [Natronomonas moolapensis 8.8.11]
MTPTGSVDGRTVVFALVGVALVVGSIGLFVADLGSAPPEPVDTEETVDVGLTLAEELRLEDTAPNASLPRVQVFYSQYPFPVGYHGVESFAAKQRQPYHRDQFGYPTAVYVTDYAGQPPELTDDGIPSTDGSPGWVAAEDAVYVADSAARTPDGPASLPFSTRDAARAFAAEHGGRVIDWQTALDRPTETEPVTALRERAGTQRREANETVASRTRLRERPVSVVVGEDEPTIDEAVESAPPNTTVLVPNGTYREPVELDRPVTLRGVGDTRIVGDGNGTVVVVRSPRAAIVDVDVDGVGNAVPGGAATDDHSHVNDPSHDSADTIGDEYWDEDIEETYAGGDTAIAVETAPNALVSGVGIDTDAAGIILYESPGTVVRDVHVVGNESYRNGHMGLVAMRSPGVVEDSTFVGGLDGVYTHRSDGIVVRDNEIYDNRMGIHLMFTSGSVLYNNTVSGQEYTGIHVMTGPERNAVVGNRITETVTALVVGGSESYVADNVISDNNLGFQIDVVGSIVEGNVFADNRAGAEARAQLPTNRVFDNDFVANEQHVRSAHGRLRIWTDDGEGNYWEGATGRTDGTVIQRTYTPTDPVDGRLHRTDGTATLARAPALDALAGFQGAIPGMRADAVIDTAPLCEPANEAWFERTGRTDTEPVCASGTRRSLET